MLFIKKQQIKDIMNIKLKRLKNRSKYRAQIKNEREYIKANQQEAYHLKI